MSDVLGGDARVVPGAVARAFWVLLCLAVFAPSAGAAITIEGVENKKVYADRVSFVVRPEAGSDYTAELNGAPVAIGVRTEVREPDYYELLVRRTGQPAGTEESRLVQFIVRATDRKNSEWGLRRWTPYPAIDSAAAEFEDATLEIVMPAEYPQGLEIPVIAWVRDGSGNRVGVNGAVTAGGFEAHPLRVLRGVGSVFLPAATAAGVVPYTAQIRSLVAEKTITIEPSTAWQTASGDIAASVNWGENARVRIAGPLRVVAGATLTIGSGSVVVVDPGIEIAVEGQIAVHGTLDRPVVFTCPDRTVPWGGFVFEKGSSQGEFTGAILTGSGADPDWFDNNPGHGHSHRHEEPLLYVSNGARVTLTDCGIVENHGQAGHGEKGFLTMTRCLVQKCITAGQYNGGTVMLEDCALIEFPGETTPFADDDNDGLYLTSGAHFLTNCLIGWALDDAVDAGSGSNGSVTIDRCWIESAYHEAIAWSEEGTRTASDTVTLNCGQGIECGFGSPEVNTAHCLSTANLVGARFGDNYDWDYDGFLKVRDSLLLFNQRDIWGRAWDDWTVHLDQMDIKDSYVTIPDADFPNNRIWDPQADPNQLELLRPFLPSQADTVGVGIATLVETQNLASLQKGVPVRLSTFTMSPVSVNYTIEAEGKELAAGALHFVPGETVKFIPLPAGDDLCEISLALSDPINAELTGLQRVTLQGDCRTVGELILEGDVWRYFKGTQEPPAGWNALEFDDSQWLSGPTPIGFEASSGYAARIATNLPDMQGKYVSVYARREFVIEDPSRVTGLTLTMDYDDGYIAYLNGVRVAAAAAPNNPAYDQRATASHEACCGTGSPTGPCPPAPVDLTDHIADLAPGVNVLAVQAHNQSSSSSDFIFIPELFVTFEQRP